MAAMLDCDEPGLTEMIACLKTISISELTKATSDYLVIYYLIYINQNRLGVNLVRNRKEIMISLSKLWLLITNL